MHLTTVFFGGAVDVNLMKHVASTKHSKTPQQMQDLEWGGFQSTQNMEVSVTHIACRKLPSCSLEIVGGCLLEELPLVGF